MCTNLHFATIQAGLIIEDYSRDPLEMRQLEPLLPFSYRSAMEAAPFTTGTTGTVCFVLKSKVKKGTDLW